MKDSMAQQHLKAVAFALLALAATGAAHAQSPACPPLASLTDTDSRLRMAENRGDGATAAALRAQLLAVTDQLESLRTEQVAAEGDSEEVRRLLKARVDLSVANFGDHGSTTVIGDYANALVNDEFAADAVPYIERLIHVADCVDRPGGYERTFRRFDLAEAYEMLRRPRDAERVLREVLAQMALPGAAQDYKETTIERLAENLTNQGRAREAAALTR